MRPWYQVEAALRRAEARTSNKNHYPKPNIPLMLGGAIAGAGTGAYQSTTDTTNSILNDALKGSVLGLGAGALATRGNTPAAAKLLRDLGRASWATVGRPVTKEASASARRTAPTTAVGNLSDWINEAVREALKDKRNDGVVPLDSAKLAEKKGDRK